jgi:PAP2 superfamily
MSMSVETEPREIGDTSPAGLMAIGAPGNRSNHRTKQLVWPVLLALLGAAALSIDVPLAQWVRSKGVPGGVNKLCQLAEVFGHGAGAAAILLAAWVLAPRERTRLPRAIGTTYLAGLGANVVKFLLARSRPHTIEQLRGTSPLATFHGWLPAFSHGSAWQSFPSSHTAAAVGLALGLSWVFPRGKWLFAAFAVLAAGQRIVSSNHFLSDVLWGAALGWICAAACLPGGWLSPLFDRLETWQASLVQRVER